MLDLVDGSKAHDAAMRPDVSGLTALISGLSDVELSALERDLEQCHSTGLPSRRILELLDTLGALDDGWRERLQALRASETTRTFRFRPAVSRLRSQAQSLPAPSLLLPDAPA